MTRSVKKTPVQSTTLARSEKKDKKIWHGRLRHLDKQRLAQAGDLEGFVATDARAVSDPRVMDKDGRHYMTTAEELDEAKQNARKHPGDAKALERELHKLRAK